PRVPGYIIAVILATAVVWVFHLDQRFGVATIESRFAGGIPQGFPRPSLPHLNFSLERIKALIPSATTIALLAGIESLLSAVVAWGMSERDHFKTILRAPRSDVAVLLTTFGLTVFADLTIAVGVGMVLASMLFMKRMSEVTNIGALREEMEDQPDDLSNAFDPNSIEIG